VTPTVSDWRSYFSRNGFPPIPVDRRSFAFDRGFGLQRAMALDHWLVSSPTEPLQRALFGAGARQTKVKRCALNSEDIERRHLPPDVLEARLRAELESVLDRARLAELFEGQNP